jgi:hypothetical protein
LPADKLVQHTTGVTGHYYPSVYRDSLLFSTFTSNGLRIGGAATRTEKPSSLPTVSFGNRLLPYRVALDSSTNNVLAAAGSGNYPVKRYPKPKVSLIFTAGRLLTPTRKLQPAFSAIIS